MQIKRITERQTSHFKNELIHVGHWPTNSSSPTSIPIFHVSTPRAFNQIIGYAKFINGSNGTVLYRGQAKDYGSLVPSGARPNKVPIPNSTIDSMRIDKGIQKIFNLNNDDIKGWELYQNILIESALQHYGGNTYCMDFVDNHWSSLWFGLYQFSDNTYAKRTGDNEKLYIYLYLADTNGPCVRGLYLGEDTYTIDLRKALPSIFARPGAQHGWIVRKHKRQKCNYDDSVIGVLEINVTDAAEWLGDGNLLSQENFFPDFLCDQGYQVLLERQFCSGIASRRKKILPTNTIRNYHYVDTYYSSDKNFSPKPLVTTSNQKELPFSNLSDLYAMILERGWTSNTCFSKDLWNEENPAIGQSAVTALLVQKYFGGEIMCFDYSNRKHYYNCINTYYFDLNFNELNDTRKVGYPPSSSSNLGTEVPRLHKKYDDKLKVLIENCGLSDF